MLHQLRKRRLSTLRRFTLLGVPAGLTPLHSVVGYVLRTPVRFLGITLRRLRTRSDRSPPLPKGWLLLSNYAYTFRLPRISVGIVLPQNRTFLRSKRLDRIPLLSYIKVRRSTRRVFLPHLITWFHVSGPLWLRASPLAWRVLLRDPSATSFLIRSTNAAKVMPGSAALALALRVVLTLKTS